MIFNHNTIRRYGYRKSKAIKGLGVALLGTVILGTSVVSADEVSSDNSATVEVISNNIDQPEIVEDNVVDDQITEDVVNDQSVNEELNDSLLTEVPSMIADRSNEGEPLDNDSVFRNATNETDDSDLETSRNPEYYDFYLASNVDGDRVENSISEWVNKDKLSYLALKVSGTNEVIENAKIEFKITNVNRLKQYSIAHPEPGRKMDVEKNEENDSVTFSTSLSRLVSGQDIKLPFNLAWKKYVPNGDVSNLSLKFFDGDHLLKENHYTFEAKTLNLRDFKLNFDKTDESKYDQNGDPYNVYATTNDSTNNDPDNIKSKSEDPSLVTNYAKFHNNKSFSLSLKEESNDQDLSNEEYLNMVWDGIGVGPEFVDNYYYYGSKDKDLSYVVSLSTSHKQFDHNYSKDLDEAIAIKSTTLNLDEIEKISKVEDMYSKYGTRYKFIPGTYIDDGFIVIETSDTYEPIPIKKEDRRQFNNDKVLFSHENIMNLIKASTGINGSKSELKNEVTTIKFEDKNGLIKDHQSISHKNPNIIEYKAPAEKTEKEPEAKPQIGRNEAPVTGSVIISNLSNFWSTAKSYSSATNAKYRDNFGFDESYYPSTYNSAEDLNKANDRHDMLSRGNYYGTNTNLRILSRDESNSIIIPPSIDNTNGHVMDWSYVVKDPSKLDYTLDYVLGSGVNYMSNPAEGISIKEALVNVFQEFNFYLPRLFNSDTYNQKDESTIETSLDNKALANVTDGSLLISNLPVKHKDKLKELLSNSTIKFFNNTDESDSTSVRATLEEVENDVSVPGPENSPELQAFNVKLSFASPEGQNYKYMKIDVPMPDDETFESGWKNDWYYLVPRARFLLKGNLSNENTSLGSSFVESVMSGMYVTKDDARNGLFDEADYSKNSNWSNAVLTNPSENFDPESSPNSTLIPKVTHTSTFVPVLESHQTSKFVDGIHTLKGYVSVPSYESPISYTTELSDYVIRLSNAWSIKSFNSVDGLNFEKIESESDNEITSYRLFKDDMTIDLKGSYSEEAKKAKEDLDVEEKIQNPKMFNFEFTLEPNERISTEYSTNGESVSFFKLDAKLKDQFNVGKLIENQMFQSSGQRPDINNDGKKETTEGDSIAKLNYALPLYLNIHNLNSSNVTNNVLMNETSGTQAGDNLVISTKVDNKTGVKLMKPVIVTTIPKANDSTVLGNSSRGSRFDTVLVETPSEMKGYEIFYSTQNVDGLDATKIEWSNVAPDDLSTVTAVKWVANDDVELTPDKAISFNLTVKTPETALNNSRIVSTSAISVNDKPFIEGYRTIARVISDNKSGSVVVDYYSVDGTLIKNEQEVVTEVAVDSEYDSTTEQLRPETIEFEGKVYYLKEHKQGSDDPTGRVTETTKRVTYLYELPQVEESYKEGKVIVHYVSDDEQPITIKDDVLNTPLTNVVKVTKQVLSSGKVIDVKEEDLGINWSLLEENKPESIKHDKYTYEFLKVKDGDSVNGQLVEGTTELTLIYTKPVITETTENYGNVDVSWISTSNINLKDTERSYSNVKVSTTTTTITGGFREDSTVETNERYDVENKKYDILTKDGIEYKFIKLADNSDMISDKIKTENSHVIFVYSPIESENETVETYGNVLVEYYIKDTNDKLLNDAVVENNSLVESTHTTIKSYINENNEKTEYSRTSDSTQSNKYYSSTNMRLNEIEKDGIRYRYVSMKDSSATETGLIVEGTTIIKYEYEPIMDFDIPNDYPTIDQPSIEFDIPNDYPTIDKPSIEFDIPNDYPTIDQPSIEFDIPNDYPTIDKPSIEFDIPNDYPTIDKPSIEFDIPNDYPTIDKPSIEFEIPSEDPKIDNPPTEVEIPSEDPKIDNPPTEVEIPSEDPHMDNPPTEVDQTNQKVLPKTGSEVSVIQSILGLLSLSLSAVLKKSKKSD